MNFDKKAQGNRVKLLRKKLKMSQKTFASDILDCEQGYFSQIETGIKPLSYNTIENISKRYTFYSKENGISMDWLLLGVGEMFLDRDPKKITVGDGNQINAGEGNTNTTIGEQGLEGLRKDIEHLRRENETLREANSHQ
jgi:transcriptional regulator with XRE-family HTH domain